MIRASSRIKFPALEAVLEFPVKEKWVTGLHTGNIALGQEFDSNKQAYESKTLDFKYASQLKDLIDLQVKYTKHANNPAALNAVDYSMSVGGGFGNWTCCGCAAGQLDLSGGQGG